MEKSEDVLIGYGIANLCLNLSNLTTNGDPRPSQAAGFFKYTIAIKTTGRSQV
jgi:hypothetical protein